MVDCDKMLGDKDHSFILDNSKIKRVVPDFVCTTPLSTAAVEMPGRHRADPARQQVDENFNAICERILRAYAKAWPEK